VLIAPFLPFRVKLRVFQPYCYSILALVVCTWIAFRFHLEAAAVGFLYLIIVSVSAIDGDFWLATVISVLASAGLDYFFIPPICQFTISDPRNWFALGTFEFTALMLSQLSRRAQMRTEQAEMERQNGDRLYQLAQRILLLDRSRHPGAYIPPLVRELFELSAVTLFDAHSASTHTSGSVAGSGSEDLARLAYSRDKEELESRTGTWSCPLRLGSRPVGGLALCGGNLTPVIVAAIATLSSIALERARSFEKENSAEAARQLEQLRTAVLDALAHQIKTPLTVIRTASSGLLAAGGLSEPQAELITLVDNQAQALNDLASRLLGAAELDGADLRPNCEPRLLSNLVNETLAHLHNDECRNRFRLTTAEDEPLVWVDRELIESALSQLFDNAAKYSEPDSPIDIEIAVADADVTVTVRDRGLLISLGERDRIFERFYRGRGSKERSPGTGLGLSIVRKIVDAHHGRVGVESDAEHGTAFTVALPLAGKEDQALSAAQQNELRMTTTSGGDRSADHSLLSDSPSSDQPISATSAHTKR
jgi:two-component system, OmpR family, sensor histidine kinase KdpD